tara:strand:- start:6719 stop:7747 length:1029 start_codon:yes stop_codon:yes gene_type:complete
MIYLLIIITTLLFLSIYIFIAKITNLIDKKTSNNELKNNLTSKKYLIGGLVIYSNIVALNFFFNNDNQLNNILIISLLILITGLIDDYINLPVSIRLLVQFFAAILIGLFGIKIISLGFLIDNKEILLGYFSIFFTSLCIVVLTNSINYFDGIDGNASSSSMMCLVYIFFIIFYNNNINIIENNKIFLVLFITLPILFILNIIPIMNIKIFLGDAGSTLLGFLMSCFLIIYSQEPYYYFHPVLCIWCVTMPIYDFLNVTIKRIIQQKNPLSSDNQHIHYVLIKSGFSNIQTLIVINIISLLLFIIGLISISFINPLVSLILYVILFLVYFKLTEYLYSFANE